MRCQAQIGLLLACLAASDAFAPTPLPLAPARAAAGRAGRGLRVACSAAPLEEAASRRQVLGAALGLAIGAVVPKSAFADPGNQAVMTIKTADGIAGEVVIEFLPDVAPQTVEAFKKYAREGLYDGTAFHRVNQFLKTTVLVGGDPNTKEEPFCVTKADYKGEKKSCSNGAGYGPDGYIQNAKRASNDDDKNTRALWDKGGPDGWRKDALSQVKLEPEFGGKHEAGTISMRRFGKPDSAGSQFFICLDDMSKELDGHSAVFGKIVTGLDVLKRIDTKAMLKSPSALEFPRDDGKMSTTRTAWDRPVARQGIESIKIQ